MTPRLITQAIAQAWPYVSDEEIERGQMLALLDTADVAMADDQAADLELFVLSAMVALEKGRATDVDVSNLAVIGNMTMLLAEIGYGADALAEIKSGQQACNSLRERHARTGRAVCKGPELLAIRKLVDMHVQQLALRPTAHEIRTVVAEMRRRLAQGEVM